MQTNFRYNYIRRKFYERWLFYLLEVRPMDQHQAERVQPDERIRGHLVNAVVWYFCVSIANIYRQPQQKIKNAAQYITFDRVIE